MKTHSRAAFSLIEMIIVIGIIGVLAGVLLSKFGGATDSARASQCATNMKNLVTAAHSYAMSREDGCFPAAGNFPYEDFSVKDRKVFQAQRTGWISGSRGSKSSNVRFNENAPETLRFALTNGVLWKTVGQSYKVYQCPIHAETCRKANNGQLPGWSYAMNMQFGSTELLGEDNKHWYGINMAGISIRKDDGGSISRPAEKVLMFAEIQGLDIKTRDLRYTAETGNGGDAANPVLDYTKEQIGFNHSVGHGRYAGHVAFADGHVERVIAPKDATTLTKALCKGHEVSFNGTTYTDEQSNDR